MQHKPARGRSDAPRRLSGAQFAAIAAALADPRRYSILREVAAASGRLACCDLQEAERVTAATISYHIKELEQAGLIEIVRQGKFATLSFRQDTFEAYLRQLAQTLQPAP